MHVWRHGHRYKYRNIYGYIHSKKTYIPIPTSSYFTYTSEHVQALKHQVMLHCYLLGAIKIGSLSHQKKQIINLVCTPHWEVKSNQVFSPYLSYFSEQLNKSSNRYTIVKLPPIRYYLTKWTVHNYLGGTIEKPNDKCIDGNQGSS